MEVLKFTTLSLIVTLYGCGGGSSSPETESTKTGVFLDSPISNIGYRTETKEGVTNPQGEYEYVSGETVIFFIGDLEFPPATAASVVTPLNIANTQDTSDPVVVNMIRLLQTLDKNGNPDDGIEIAEQAKQNATQVDFDLSVSAFEASSVLINLVANSGSSNVTLVSSNDAISHFEEQLEGNGLSFGELYGVWEFPNENVIFMYLPGGRYFAIQWEEENNFIGFERGTYESSEAEITFTTLQNNDGEALVCNEPASNTCSGEVFEFSISGDELTLDPSSDESATVFERLF